MQNIRQLQLFHREDGLRNQPQNHRWSVKGVQEIDADPYEREGVGSIEFLFPEKTVNLLRRQDFLEPASEYGGAGDRPIGGQHLPSGAITRLFSDAEVHIGISLFKRRLHNRLEAGRPPSAGCRCRFGGPWVRWRWRPLR